MKDNREICNLLCKAGRDEYDARKKAMWLRQDKKCCLHGRYAECLGSGKEGRIPFSVGVFEHEAGRGHGGGHRDDRIEINGKPINGLSCPACNSRKGSQRISYNDAP